MKRASRMVNNWVHNMFITPSSQGFQREKEPWCGRSVGGSDKDWSRAQSTESSREQMMPAVES